MFRELLQLVYMQMDEACGASTQLSEEFPAGG